MVIFTLFIAATLGFLTGMSALIAGAGWGQAFGLYVLSTYGYAIAILVAAWLHCRLTRAVTGTETPAS